MDLIAELEKIDRTTLRAPVRQALQRETVELVSWEYSVGGAAGNQVSAGVYRFTGLGRDQGDTIPWSIILKVIQSSTNGGIVNTGEITNVLHWNYWRREKCAYQSGLLDELPKGLGVPRCCGIEERAEDVVWLWLEDVADIHEGVWSLERYRQAALHLGRFNGIYLAELPLPSFRWLSSRILRQWCTVLRSNNALFDAKSVLSIWRQVIKPHISVRDMDLLLLFWNEHHRLLDVLDRLPQTLCHRDAAPNNLLTRRDRDGTEETVAIDWALMGIGPVGEELAPLTAGALTHLEGREARDICQVIFDSYLEGLREVGWYGDERIVRCGYIISTAFRVGLWTLWLIKRALDRDHRNQAQEGERNAFQTCMEQQRNTIRFVVDLAEETLKLSVKGKT